MATLREKLFYEGSSAIRKIFDVDDDVYVCPICRGVFGVQHMQNKELTLEHVPPASVGGKAIILTCKECNNQAGHKFECHESKKKKVINFANTLLGGKDGHGGKGRLKFEGVSVNVAISTSGGKTTIEILEGQNNPNLSQNITESIEDVIGISPQPEIQFNIESIESYDFKKYQLSLLKSAYLVAVAKFGYCYGLSPTLENIRCQIKEPENVVVENWHIKPNCKLQSNILGVDHKNGVVIVVLGGESVLLPWHLSSMKNYKSITNQLAENVKYNFSFVPVVWPTSFEAALD